MFIFLFYLLPLFSLSYVFRLQSISLILFFLSSVLMLFFIYSGQAYFLCILVSVILASVFTVVYRWRYAYANTMSIRRRTPLGRKLQETWADMTRSMSCLWPLPGYTRDMVWVHCRGTGYGQVLVMNWFGTRLRTKMEFLCGNSPSKTVYHRLDWEWVSSFLWDAGTSVYCCDSNVSSISCFW